MVVELLGPGNCTGLLAALGRVPHPFFCLALTNVEVLEIESAGWRQATLCDPELLRTTASLAVPRMLGGYGFMAAMATGDVESRIALALLRLEDINSRHHGPAAPIPLTRKALVEIGATTVKTAIRITSRWDKTGTIRAARKSIMILDRAELYSLVRLREASNVFNSDGVLTPRHQLG